jgi:hypothetical protein
MAALYREARILQHINKLVSNQGYMRQALEMSKLLIMSNKELLRLLRHYRSR